MRTSSKAPPCESRSDKNMRAKQHHAAHETSAEPPRIRPPLSMTAAFHSTRSSDAKAYISAAHREPLYAPPGRAHEPPHPSCPRLEHPPRLRTTHRPRAAILPALFARYSAPASLRIWTHRIPASVYKSYSAFFASACVDSAPARPRHVAF